MIQARQLPINEILGFFKRRYRLMAIPAVGITLLAFIGSFFVPRQYESSIKILIQPPEVQNPLSSMGSVMGGTSEDPLRAFEEIILSQRSISMLIDSLDLKSQAATEIGRRQLMTKLQRSIVLRVEPRQSFTITFYSENPQLAFRGAGAIAAIFIETVSGAKNKRNEMTVDFYQRKLADFRGKFEDSQRQIVRDFKKRAGGAVPTYSYIYTRLDQLDAQIAVAERKLGLLVSYTTTVRDRSALLATDTGKQTLFELQRSDVPYASDLRVALLAYEEVTRRYTLQHPEVVKAEAKINTILERVQVALENEITMQRNDLDELRKKKAESVDELMNATVLEGAAGDKESNYSIYQKLYNELKIKLEEAQISLALGRNSGEQYLVIDSPILPLFPSKPSRFMIVAGALAAGLVIGFLTALVLEFLDTTIRNPEIITVYKKPIIAYLPDVRIRVEDE